jgi:CopG family transcriptional regulator/antitoxin EndoAI
MKTTANISITMPIAMLREAERLAKRENRTMSELIREALRHYRRDREWEETLAYGRSKAKEMGVKASDVERLIHEYRQEKEGRKSRIKSRTEH